MINTVEYEKSCIERLMGEVSTEQLKNTDRFIGEKMLVFMPIMGFCEHAVSSVHSHPSYQIVFAFSDKLSFEIDGEIFKTRPQSLLLIPPGTYHKEIEVEYFVSYISVFIEKNLFEDQLLMYEGGYKAEVDVGFIKADGNMLSVIKDYMSEASSNLPGCEALKDAIALKFSHMLIRSITGIRTRGDEISRRLEINKTIEYMNANLNQKITVEGLAEVAHMSPSHYNRVFKREMGQSCISYLNNIRHERVKHLLKEGERTITQIAMDCGFSSPAYLSSSFHLKYNMTPTEYQKNFSKGHILKK